MTPAGTLIIGSSAADYYWIQAISVESRDLLATEGETLADGSIRVSPEPGVTQLVVTQGDDVRLIAARDYADPTEVATQAFDLEDLPSGWTFNPASPEAFMAASFNPAEDPSEMLPEGASVFLFTRPDSSTIDAVRVPSPPDSLAGLLVDLELLGDSTYAGQILPGLEVTLLPDSDGQSTIVLHNQSTEPVEFDSFLEAVNDAQ